MTFQIGGQNTLNGNVAKSFELRGFEILEEVELRL